MKNRILPCTLVLGLGCLCAEATDNFPVKPLSRATDLPNPRQLLVTPWYTYTRFQRYWSGHDRVSIETMNTDDFELNNGMIHLDYGIQRDLALDLTLGYTSAATRFVDAGREPRTTQGLMDVTLGVRYVLVDETRHDNPWLPTVGVRAGAIIQGTYTSNYPFAPGGGASGFEPSLLLHKRIGKSGFGLYGDLGFRWRNHDVPTQLLATIGLFQDICSFTLNLAYKHTESLSGGDLSGRGPAIVYSPRVKENNQILEAGVRFTDKGGRQYQFYVDWNVEGRNTGEKLTYGLFLTWPFGI